MLVLDEQRHFGIQPNQYILPLDKQNGAAFDPDNQADARRMVLRDRNRPCVFAWSLCNEPECEFMNATVALAAGKLYKDIILELDPTRPITGAMIHFTWSGGAALGSVLDIQGFNYQDGVYDGFHLQHNSTPMIATETHNGNEDRGEYGGYAGYLSSFDMGQEGWWKDQVGYDKPGWTVGNDLRPFQMGGFVWTGFDYKGECHWPSVNSNFGTVDLAGFWKDRAYWYKAQWTTTPVLHVFPGWAPPPTRGMPQACNTSRFDEICPPSPSDMQSCYSCCHEHEDKTHELTKMGCVGPDVWQHHCSEGAGAGLIPKLAVFTNADMVECTIEPADGSAHTPLGQLVVPPLGDASYLSVNYTLGVLRCVGSYNDTLATAPIVRTLRTAGPAAALRVSTEMGQISLRADGQDVALIRVEVIDAAGLLVPSDRYHSSDLNHSVSFTVDGPGKIIGVGNGDPHCHEPDKSTKRSAFHGLVRAIVQSSGRGKSGAVTVHAIADGLLAGELKLNAAALELKTDDDDTPPAESDI